MKRALTILAVLVSASLATSADAETKYFAKNNLRIHRGNVSIINYQAGKLIPVGTRVKVTKRGSKYWDMKAGAMKFRFYTHRATRLSLTEAFALSFTKNGKPDLSVFTPREKKLIKKGRVEKGMSRRAVLVSLGMPPPHKTPTLDDGAWTYWESKNSTFRVVFDGDVVQRIDRGEKKKGSFLGGLFAGGSDDETPKNYYYANANVYTYEGEVSWVNYLNGPVIKIGTKVEVTDIDDDEIEFTVVSNGKEYKYTNDDRSGHDAKELFERVFSKKSPTSQLEQMEKRQRRKIKSARARVGMSKEDVLMAIGPPPPHKTPSLDAEEWIYWKNRFKKMKVRFDDDDLVISVK